MADSKDDATSSDQTENSDADGDGRDDDAGGEELGEKGKQALERERERRKAAERDAKEKAARLAELERKQAEADAAKAKADEEDAAKRGEFEKLAAKRAEEIDRLKAEIAKRDHDALRDRIARKHKLPDALATRLRGDTEADLEADATELAELIPVDPERARGNGGDPRPSGLPKPDDDKALAANARRYG
jgi:hypothetical protein